MRTGELCTREVITAGEDESLRDVARRMNDEHVGCLVVLDAEAKARPVGIVTDRDLVRVLALDELGHGRELKVSDVMSRDLLVGDENEGAFEALARMRARGVRRLPIVGADRTLVGLLTFDDLLEWLAEELGNLARLVAREQRNERTIAGSGDGPRVRR